MARAYNILEIEIIWVSQTTCTKYGYIQVKPLKTRKEGQFVQNHAKLVKYPFLTYKRIYKSMNILILTHSHTQIQKETHNVAISTFHIL